MFKVKPNLFPLYFITTSTIISSILFSYHKLLNIPIYKDNLKNLLEDVEINKQNEYNSKHFFSSSSGSSYYQK